MYTPNTRYLGLWQDINGDGLMQNAMNQNYPLLTGSNVASVRGQFSAAAYPLNMSYIYQQSDLCSTANDNAALFAKGVSLNNDGTSPLSIWTTPIPYSGKGQIPSGPLSSACHWSLPIVDVTPGDGASNSCVQTYNDNGNSYNFISSDNTQNFCNLWFGADIIENGDCDSGPLGFREFLSCLSSSAKTTVSGTCQVEYPYNGIGSAFFYARSLAYPQTPCVEGTLNLLCGPASGLIIQSPGS